MDITFGLPKIFESAKKSLSIKFPHLDKDLIEDSIQYALIEYWGQGKYITIENDRDALRWYLKVAHNYLYKEIDRAKRFRPYPEIFQLNLVYDFEENYIRIDLYNCLLEKLTERKKNIIIKRGMGYTLRELANIENISWNAMKQRHARACNELSTILKKNNF